MSNVLTIAIAMITGLIGTLLGAGLTIMTWRREKTARSKQNAFDLAVRWDSDEMAICRNNAWGSLAVPQGIDYWRDPWQGVPNPAQTRSDLLRVLRFFRLIDSLKKSELIDQNLTQQFFGDTYKKWEEYIKIQDARYKLLIANRETVERAEDYRLFRVYEWIGQGI